MTKMMSATILAALILTACGGRPEPAADAPADVREGDRAAEAADVPVNATLKSDDTTVQLGTAATDARYPLAAPAYPGAKVIAFVAMDTSRAGEPKLIQTTIETEDSLAEAAAFYRNSLSAAGLSVVTDVVNEDGGLLNGNPVDNSMGTSVQFAVADGKTIVIIAGPDAP